MAVKDIPFWYTNLNLLSFKKQNTEHGLLQLTFDLRKVLISRDLVRILSSSQKNFSSPSHFSVHIPREKCNKNHMHVLDLVHDKH